MTTDRVLVIVPTYNERENLPLIAARIRANVPDAHLLVVDDASPTEPERSPTASPASTPRSTCSTAARARRGWGGLPDPEFFHWLARGRAA